MNKYSLPRGARTLPENRTAHDLARLDRARKKRRRKADHFSELAACAIIDSHATPGHRQLIEFSLQFDALLPPDVAEDLARKHLREIGVVIHDLYLTGVEQPSTPILRGDGRDAMEVGTFSADVTIPPAIMEQFAAAAAAEAKNANTDPSILDPPSGGAAVDTTSRPS